MSNVWPHAISTVLSTGIIALLYYTFRRMPALRVNAPDGAEARLPELRKEFGTWMAFAVVLYLLFATLTGLLCFEMFRGLNDWIHERRSRGIYYFQIATFVWVIPSLFLAIVLGALPCHVVMRWLLGSRFRDFVLYGHLSEGFDGTKLAWICGSILVIVVAITAPFGFDYYTRIGESGVDINSLFSLGTRHREYSEVKELRKVLSFKAPNGTIVRDEYFELEFDDGKTWSYRNNIFEGDTKHEAAVFDYLSQQTGLSVVVDDPFPLGAAQGVPDR